MSTLTRAIEIATQAHADQVDKAGAPYIAHVLRVQAGVSDPDAKIAAVLHDVVEDTDWTLDRLAEEGFSAAVLRGVDAVTRRQGEGYEAFVLRAAADPIGRQVKLADLQDNEDLSRIADPTEADIARVAKYRRAIGVILGPPQA